MPKEKNISRNSLYGLTDETDRIFFPPDDRQGDLLLQLVELVKEKPQRPIIVSPRGAGASFMRSFLDVRPPRMDVEWYPVGTFKDPFETIRGFLDSLRRYAEKHDHEILIILDEVENLSSGQIERIVGLILNWKRIKHVIIITNNLDLHLPRARKIVVDYPQGILYGLQDQSIVPVQSIIPVVRPQIITITDNLIQRLSKAPADVFKISPRQFEEVIAELLSGMGMDVELTAQTRDGGKDILAYLKTEVGRFLTLVEAKQHNKTRPVGVGLIRSLYGTLVDHGANSAMLVTSSTFTRDAREFQAKHEFQLSLKEYSDVISWIRRHKPRKAT